MKNKKLLKAGLVTAAVVLSCSMLFGCGNDKPKDSKPESSASAKHEAEGETTTSKFSGDKKSARQKKEFRLHRDHIQVRLREALIQALIIRQGVLPSLTIRCLHSLSPNLMTRSHF